MKEKGKLNEKNMRIEKKEKKIKGLLIVTFLHVKGEARK